MAEKKKEAAKRRSRKSRGESKTMRKVKVDSIEALRDNFI